MGQDKVLGSKSDHIEGWEAEVRSISRERNPLITAVRGGKGTASGTPRGSPCELDDYAGSECDFPSVVFAR
jgi:hypothetical protein